MFSKQREAPQRSLEDRQPVSNINQFRPANIQPTPTFEAPVIDSGSVIGQDLTILGDNINIVSREALRVDGEVRGDITGKRVNIGPGGVVAGKVSAETVEIDGKVEGAINAVAITLNASARVSGELLHRILVVAEGAEFEGRVRRAASNEELTPELSVRPAERPHAVPHSESMQTTEPADAQESIPAFVAVRPE